MSDPKEICKDISRLKEPMHKAHEALSKRLQYVVVETLRTRERQKMLLDAGKSKTMRSRHLLGMAMDIMPVGGYKAWHTSDWEKAHDIWDEIAVGLGYKPEKRISWDLSHFGILGDA